MTFQRTAYFPGQFLTDRDLTADQAYAADKRQVQNRLLHGHGVACGLQVSLSGTAGWVKIQPGLALDPLGNELRLLQELQVDLRAKMADALRRRGGAGFGQPSVLLALRYQERAVDPQPAFLPQSSPDAPNKPARVDEGQQVVLLLEQELDPAGLKALYWQTDLLSITHKPAVVLTVAEVECPYVFLARVTDQGEGYVVDTSVQRPVLNPEVFFDLVRQYAPDLFLKARAWPLFRQAIVAQLGQTYDENVWMQLFTQGVDVSTTRQISSQVPERISVVLYVDEANRVVGAGPDPAADDSGEETRRLVAPSQPAAPSPLYRAAVRALAAMDVPGLQESLGAALVTAALQRLPLSQVAVRSPGTGVDTVGAVVDGWAEVAPRLGNVAGSTLRELEGAVQQVTHQVLNLILPSGAMYVDQVPAVEMARALGVSPALAEEMLAGAKALAR